MIRVLALLVVVLVTDGCSKEKQYKDDPMLAASIRMRKTAELAAAEAAPKAYAEVRVTEVPEGRVLYNSHRGHVVHMHGVTIGGEPESLKILRSPIWAPDGEQVLVSYFGGETNRFELGVTREKGGDVTDVASRVEHDSISGAWSPDGCQIVYAQKDNNKGNIAIVNLDGTGVRVIDSHEADSGSPAWSPDGTSIAFESYREGNCGIYTVPVAGGTARRLTKPGEGCGQPAYSPDGQYLAYVVTHRSPTTREWVRDLRVMNLASGEQRTLVPERKQIVGIDWSPAGQWLVFGHEDKHQSDLCIIDINGDGFRKITDDPHGDTSPSWGRISD